MFYESIIKIILPYFIHYIALTECHLKDLGEVKRNWSHVLNNLEKRIIGGTNTSKYEHPFAVQFFNHGGLCGGSILTSKTMLTAAHCFDHNKNIDDMKIFSSK